ncbi:hypothetical protein [Streptomyces tsukubensis]|uniref:hypothetical protein n=1 Tax=Streptomyces tsukubensis TaxID=83656 RepID=UPI00344BFA09
MTVSKTYRDGLTEAITIDLEGPLGRAGTYEPDALAVATHRSTRGTAAEVFGIGRQPVPVLGIGDRYIPYRARSNRYSREVTVSRVGDCVDDSFNVHHQSADVIDTNHFTSASPVHVLYRAPRCDHGDSWDECNFCGVIV